MSGFPKSVLVALIQVVLAGETLGRYHLQTRFSHDLAKCLTMNRLAMLSAEGSVIYHRALQLSTCLLTPSPSTDTC